MFGEEAIFGINETKLDDKGRFVIPVHTKREEGEELVLLYNANLNVYEVYSKIKLKERFVQLNKLILESNTNREKRFYEKMLLELSKSILKSSKIDSHGRMLVGKAFEGHNRIRITGAYDHLIIDFNEEQKKK